MGINNKQQCTDKEDTVSHGTHLPCHRCLWNYELLSEVDSVSGLGGRATPAGLDPLYILNSARHLLPTNSFQCKPIASFFFSTYLPPLLNSSVANCRIYSLTLHYFTRRDQSTTKSSTMDFQPSRVGYGFHPTDEELVDYYLRLKMLGGHEQDVSLIEEVNVCDYEPWALPGTWSSYCAMFFFCFAYQNFPVFSLFSNLQFVNR